MKELESFLEYLINKKNLSNSTIIGYEKDIRDFIEYFKCKDISFFNISEEDYNIYFESLKENITISSLRRKLSSIKSFYKYLWKNRMVEGIYDYNLKLDNSKGSEKLKIRTQQNFSRIEYESFINSLETENIRDLQTKIISMLIAELNMPLANIFEIQIKDLIKYDFKKIVISKNKKILVYDTNENVEKILREYYEEYAFEKRFLFGVYNISAFRKDLEKYNLSPTDLKVALYEDEQTIYEKTKELYFKIGIGDEE